MPASPHALTYLFVPANRPERFAKALASGADRVIVDLEDAVAVADKDTARQALHAWITQDAPDLARIVLRTNDASTPWQAEDLALAATLRLPCVMLPKCESAAQIAAVCTHLVPGATLLPLIETVRGLAAVEEIAATPSVERLAFGALDFMVDLDLPRLRDPGALSNFALDTVATRIALASRLAQLPSPIAGVTPELDAAQVAADMVHARGLGFGAKMCIHPLQLPAVVAALAPSAQEVDWARRVLQAWDASSGGALQLDGKMVDRPVLLRAQRIAAMAPATPSP